MSRGGSFGVRIVEQARCEPLETAELSWGAGRIVLPREPEDAGACSGLRAE